ncbi:hypothetical protein EXU57_04275 [Segetibacter sp. 3557_3]|uniref:hypothetical protein n=1 Tax=Segetibacter sp. 3557_3 TaxID=2547429 RepID=UPI0010585B6C|nr:hypothetical protein [Segetibacter sp. 3557_3]TDH29286.1 hypothetical protein EXU57_04275 [Segetibacter sp. 3557_3]
MRFKFTLVNFIVFLAITASGQTLTGIWRGHFAQSSFGFSDERYKFEIQIDQAVNNALRGVTYSYKTTVFYGKANFQGIYTPKTNNVVLNELALVELKIEGQSSPCLMTCYLEYAKMGTLETLTGTYTSRHVNGRGDCGEGRVYLERKTTTDFEKEDFLLKKENDLLKKQQDLARKTPLKKPVPPAKRPSTATARVQPRTPVTKPGAKAPVASAKPRVGTAKPPVASAKPRTLPGRPPVTSPKPPLASAKPKLKPGAEDAVTRSETRPSGTPPVIISPPSVKEEIAKPKDEPVKPRLIPKPEILKKRSNELVKTIYTAERDLKIELYDNGDIDGDTISVYYNNQLIVSRKRLTDKPISFNIKANENEPLHEFVMVAENLGQIPPNTALMIITAGNKRYELFITSTEQKNAVVNIEFRPSQQP